MKKTIIEKLAATHDALEQSSLALSALPDSAQSFDRLYVRHVHLQEKFDNLIRDHGHALVLLAMSADRVERHAVMRARRHSPDIITFRSRVAALRRT